jgi:hypothetical protein
MTDEARKAIAQSRLATARSNVLNYAGSGDAAIDSALTPEQQAFRQALKQRLAAARARTYTYRNPANIPGNPSHPDGIHINMGGRRGTNDSGATYPTGTGGTTSQPAEMNTPPPRENVFTGNATSDVPVDVGTGRASPGPGRASPFVGNSGLTPGQFYGRGHNVGGSNATVRGSGGQTPQEFYTNRLGGDTDMFNDIPGRGEQSFIDWWKSLFSDG